MADKKPKKVVKPAVDQECAERERKQRATLHEERRRNLNDIWLPNGISICRSDYRNCTEHVTLPWGGSLLCSLPMNEDVFIHSVLVVPSNPIVADCGSINIITNNSWWVFSAPVLSLANRYGAVTCGSASKRDIFNGIYSEPWQTLIHVYSGSPESFVVEMTHDVAPTVEPRESLLVELQMFAKWSQYYRNKRAMPWKVRE